MSASRVATAVTMNAEGIKFGVQQANDSLKKLVTVSKQTDNSLKTLKFLETWKTVFGAVSTGVRSVIQTFNSLVRAISNPISQIPFVSAMSEFVKKTVEATEVQRNLATALGVSMEQFAGLRLAAETTGVSLTQLYEPISKLPRKIDDALRGMSDALTTFQRLPGVDLNKLGDAKPFDQFQIVIDAINKMPNIGERFAVINKIFEESGLKFRQFFATGSSGLKELIKLAKDLNLVPSRDDLANIRVLKKELVIIGQQWEAISRDVLIEISPELITFLKTVRDYLSDEKLRKNLVEGISSAFLKFSETIIKFIDEVVKIVGFLSKIVDFFTPSKKPETLEGALAQKPMGTYTGGSFQWLWGPAFLGDPELKRIKKQNTFKVNEKEETNFFGDLFKDWQKNRAKMLADLEEERKRLKENMDLNSKSGRQAQENVDKIIEKISYRAVSNAASGAAPGKLSGADINTSAGLEMFLKSFEPGYGEDKQVTVLKEIKKEIIKGNQQQDKTAELAGAT